MLVFILSLIFTMYTNKASTIKWGWSGSLLHQVFTIPTFVSNFRGLYGSNTLSSLYLKPCEDVDMGKLLHATHLKSFLRIFQC